MYEIRLLTIAGDEQAKVPAPDSVGHVAGRVDQTGHRSRRTTSLNSPVTAGLCQEW